MSWAGEESLLGVGGQDSSMPLFHCTPVFPPKGSHTEVPTT